MQKKNNVKLITSIAIASVSLVAFLVMMILVLNNYTFKIDKFDVVVAENRTSGWTSFFKYFTHIGSFYTLAVLAVIGVVLLFFVFKQKRLSIVSGVCFACVCVSNYIIKRIVERPRPLNLMIIKETGFSFPSGHTMMSFAFFGLLIWITAMLIKNKPLKISLISIFSVLVLMISFSRIYLGVHYLTDILAGWFVTLTIILVFAIIYYSKLFRKGEKHE